MGALRGDQGDAGDDAMGAAGEQAQDAGGVGGVFGLAQDVVVESDCGIGSQDGESVRGLEYGGIF